MLEASKDEARAIFAECDVRASYTGLLAAVDSVVTGTRREA